MSNKELDNLFKDKLEGFEKKPRRDLWAEIDSQLPGKRKKPIWLFMSVAASLLLLITAGYFIFKTDGLKQAPTQVAEVIPSEETTNTTPTPTLEQESEKTNIQDASMDGDDTIEKPTQPEVKKPLDKKSEQKNTLTTKDVSNAVALQEPEFLEVETDLAPIQLDETELIAKIDEPEATLPQEASSTTQSKGNTMVFDISQFAKEPALADTKSDSLNKKESKLKKIWNIAKDIKQGESGLGDLRAAKNDLFAMGFKKDENGK